MTLSSLVARFRTWLQRKSNFMFFGTLTFGGLSWLATVCQFGDFGLGVGFVLFVLAVWLLAGVAWSWCMWHVRSKLYAAHGQPRINDSPNRPNNDHS
jgi:hypothetical protein